MSLPVFTYDVAFYIGDTHTVCEDYGRCEGTVLAISDGCSSSPDSDWSARFLATAASRLDISRDDFAARAASQALAAVISADIAGPLPRPEDEMTLGQLAAYLDATLLAVGTAALPDPDQGGDIRNFVIVRAHGDGIIVVDYDDGTREIYKIEYSGNAPYYPSYLLSTDRFTKYVAQCGGVGTVTVSVGSAAFVPFQTLPPGEAFVLRLPADKVARVTVMTDGALSYTSRDGSAVNDLDIINELCAYKTSNGDFVQRRMNKARKTFAKNGLVQNDDLTVGCYNLQVI